MSSTTLFFDRAVGKAVPDALARLKLAQKIEAHYRHFRRDVEDDVWLAAVGQRGWIVFSHDRKFHILGPEKEAVRQHRIGCFYLWGAQDKRWEKMRCFARAYDHIIEAIESTPRPFIYDVYKSGRLIKVEL